MRTSSHRHPDTLVVGESQACGHALFELQSRDAMPEAAIVPVAEGKQAMTVTRFEAAQSDEKDELDRGS